MSGPPSVYLRVSTVSRAAIALRLFAPSTIPHAVVHLHTVTPVYTDAPAQMLGQCSWNNPLRSHRQLPLHHYSLCFALL
jgi:hypothetical protein